MKYMGSKARISKEILPIMLAKRVNNQLWVEPFVGGGNMIDKVAGQRMGSDSNANAIKALIYIRDDVEKLPRTRLEFTEEDYKKLRYSDDYKYKSYVGFSCSYSGKWLGGWCRSKCGTRDYVNEAYRNAAKQSSLLSGVTLVCCSYTDLELREPSIIYCDPPYYNTTGYNSKFDHSIFWEWCRKMKYFGHTIFISEYTAPDDFECIWEKTITSSLTKDTGSKKATERLFTI
jgi:DNA adenine methylase